MIEEPSIPRVVPIHVDGWAHFQETMSDVEAGLKRRGLADRAIWLESGLPASI